MTEFWKKHGWLKNLALFIIVLSLFGCGSDSESGGDTSSSSSLKEVFTPKDKLLVIAHRGASAHTPENTMLSFATALQIGADMLEADVNITKDNKLILFHDETLSRTTNGSGLVTHKTLSEIKSLDAVSWFGVEFRGEKVPALEELLEYVQDKQCYLNLEIKNKNVINQLLIAIKDYGLLERTLFSASDTDWLRLINISEPNAYLCPLVYETFSVSSLSRIIPEFGFVESPLSSWLKDNVESLNDRGIAILAYTLNEELTIRQAIEVGVQGIISDYPDRVINILSEY